MNVLSPTEVRAERLPAHVLDYPVEVVEYPGRMATPVDAFIHKNLTSLQDQGFEPFVVYNGDFLANPVGGRGQTAAWQQLLIFGGEVNLEKIIGWKGGSIMVSAVDATGTDISKTIGNIFSASQALALNSFGINKLYFRQLFFGDTVDLRLGLFTAGSVFASLPVMELPVSGATNGNPTSLFTNISGFHSVDQPSWAAYVKVKPTENTYTQAAIFQVNPRTNNVSYHGMDFSVREGDGALLMFESGWTPTFGDTKKGLEGVYMAGAYLQNFPTQTFNNTGTVNNIYGFYAQGQQKVWKNPHNENMELTLWGGGTYSPQTEAALLPVMGYGGVVLKGAIPTRPDDKFLLCNYIGGVSNSFANDSVRDGLGRPTVETVVEASYIIQLTDNLQFQPDLQWIIQPGGYHNVPNALVIGFQVAAIF
ncbi:MAG: carbohydrate porin [Chthoniobacterales bacterium]